MTAPDERQLAHDAGELFEEYFAAPYRAGRQVPVGPTGAGRGLALLRYDYLVRKGLIVRTGSPGIFKISDKYIGGWNAVDKTWFDPDKGVWVGIAKRAGVGT